MARRRRTASVLIQAGFPPRFGHPWIANPWISLAVDMAKIGFEAQQVIAMRLAKIASGRRDSQAEIERMTSEKPAALIGAQLAAATALAGGGKDHEAARKALRVYGKAVRANHRRLSRS